jgi:hypothetical protein
VGSDSLSRHERQQVRRVSRLGVGGKGTGGKVVECSAGRCIDCRHGQVPCTIDATEHDMVGRCVWRGTVGDAEE